MILNFHFQIIKEYHQKPLYLKFNKNSEDSFKNISNKQEYLIPVVNKLMTLVEQVFYVIKKV